MHTKDQLATALRQAGLLEMADKAATGYYHDYLSPLDAPGLQLLHDLAQHRTTPGAMELRQRAIDGDFDASMEESDEWANSEEGKKALQAVIASRPRST